MLSCTTGLMASSRSSNMIESFLRRGEISDQVRRVRVSQSGVWDVGARVSRASSWWPRLHTEGAECRAVSPYSRRSPNDANPSTRPVREHGRPDRIMRQTLYGVRAYGTPFTCKKIQRACRQCTNRRNLYPCWIHRRKAQYRPTWQPCKHTRLL
jgi:hypothetical protein